ncbi:hypothetical protein [Shinella sp. BYT-45]|uniref:hypothetical protein n=1 Tax=Shinella sp. BYT-45 TaxID=3377377 RepID=UPI003980BB2B
MSGVLITHRRLIEAQLVDSELVSTRHFWRKQLGYSDEIANDPRPLAVAVKQSIAKERIHVDA